MKIRAAAIIGYDGVIYTLPSPCRHGDISTYMIENLGHTPPITGEQGFILDDCRFVRRKAAARIALRANQVKGNKLISPPYLYSEDLW